MYVATTEPSYIYNIRVFVHTVYIYTRQHVHPNVFRAAAIKHMAGSYKKIFFNPEQNNMNLS